ncbi:phosphonate metabolism transcriptional regulator PhnF [Rhodobacteraceae bacterium NNCM2]|nr:phosphonate metabolism transcriptional regulator PhnF [Coraliihabitans acroporae]
MGRRAIWLEIEASLREEITSGHYRPGDKLPTEAEQATRFGVNRHTVRRALSALQDQGLVHARRGAGVFVTAEPTTYHLSRRTRFRTNLEARGHVARHRFLRLETRLCDANEAEVLGLKPGDLVHVREGIGMADDLPITLNSSLFPGTLLPDFLDHLRELGSVTMALNACGVSDYTRAWTRIAAERASATQAGHLQCAEGAALMRTHSLNIDAEGRPIEYGETYFVGERVELVVEPS